MKYIGNGRWKAGFPMRDLTPDEVEQFGADVLAATGLYEAEKPTKKTEKEA
jgi:hypothetical protein